MAVGEPTRLRRSTRSTPCSISAVRKSSVGVHRPTSGPRPSTTMKNLNIVSCPVSSLWPRWVGCPSKRRIGSASTSAFSHTTRFLISWAMPTVSTVSSPRNTPRPNRQPWRLRAFSLVASAVVWAILRQRLTTHCKRRSPMGLTMTAKPLERPSQPTRQHPLCSPRLARPTASFRLLPIINVSTKALRCIRAVRVYVSTTLRRPNPKSCGSLPLLRVAIS